MADIKDHITSTINNLRDLAYEANSEWEKSGWTDGTYLNISNSASKMLVEFSTLLQNEPITAGSTPARIFQDAAPGTAKKIQAIKAVREFTGLGLKEAKDVVDLAGSNWSDLSFAAGYNNPDDASVKKLVDDLTNAGYKVQ